MASEAIGPEDRPGRKRRPVTGGQVAFAVISPTSSAPGELRRIGEQLRAWMDHTGVECDVIGLDQLLAGKPPETPDWHFGGTITPFPAPVALVYLASAAADQATGERLEAALAGCAIAPVVTPEYWARVHR